MKKNSTMIPMLSSLSQEHYTPREVVEAIHKIYTPDLDPASNFVANSIIEAGVFYSHDALERDWFGNVYCNPPGGKTNNQSNVKLFWNKALSEFDSGAVNKFMFMFFSHEAMIFCDRAYDFCTCVFKKRLKFLKLNESDNSLVAQGFPAHASALVFASHCYNDYSTFAEVFS